MIKVIETTRSMRINPTEAETAFWNIVRGRKFSGKKFCRQFPIKFKYENQNRFVVADFYCSECRLIVEIDGGICMNEKDYDELKSYIINKLGMKVVSFSNEDILNDTQKVIKVLENETHP